MNNIDTQPAPHVALATDTLQGSRLLPESFADGPQFGECLVAGDRPASNWLWHGYIARGHVTLLTSQWKTGKTTLLAVLLKQFDQRGELGGLEVQPSRSIVLSEESADFWHERTLRLGLGHNARFFCRPFVTKPTRRQWSALITYLDALRVADGLDLVVIDTLSTFLPAGAECQGDLMLRLLKQLERLTRAGVAVLLLHHPPKGPIRPGQAARGTGVLAGYADVLIEMRMLEHGDRHDRRRRLSAWSRLNDTPRELVIELSAEGDRFTAREDVVDEDQHHGLQSALDVLTRYGRRMACDEILKEWPESRKPPRGTLWGWLERAVEQGTLLRRGTGRRGDPFVYHLAAAKPEMEDLLSDSLDEIFNRKW
jgi:hypothetical protein